MSVTKPLFKTCYAYNDKTLEFVAEAKAWLSPLEGTYPLPAHAVATPPPSIDMPYKSARLNKTLTAWEVVDDFRQKPLWNKVTGLAIPNHLSLGEALPADATIQPPPVIASNDPKRHVWGANGWVVVADYTRRPLWDKRTSLPTSNDLQVGDSLPDHLTLDPPPIQQGFASVWSNNDSAWEQVPDLRGVTYYDIAGMAHTITQVGEIVPENAQLQPPTALPSSPAEINANLRDRYMATATACIAPLQDASDLGIATDAEAEQLTALRRYRVELSRLDITQPGLVWPVPPTEAPSPADTED